MVLNGGSNPIGIVIWKQPSDALAVDESLQGLANNYNKRRFCNGKKTLVLAFFENESAADTAVNEIKRRDKTYKEGKRGSCLNSIDG
jgi:hypothetical protein